MTVGWVNGLGANSIPVIVDPSVIAAWYQSSGAPRVWKVWSGPGFLPRPVTYWRELGIVYGGETALPAPLADRLVAMGYGQITGEYSQ